MNERLQTQPKPSSVPAPMGLLRRTGPSEAASSSVPPLVHEVLGSPGKPLEPEARTQMEPRFGHDFSKVRIHTDAPAEKSALAVNALAYTVGRDIVFGAAQYSPQTIEG